METSINVAFEDMIHCSSRHSFDPFTPLPLFFGALTTSASQMVFVGYNEVFPLWMMSTSEVGGLGWATKKIGQVTRTFLECIKKIMWTIAS